MIKITQVRHAWPENAGFNLLRPNGHENYTFIHFYNSIDIEINGKKIRTAPHACILYDIGFLQNYSSRVDFTHDWFHFSGDCDSLMEEYGLEYNRLYYPSNPIFITDIVREIEKQFFSPLRFTEKLHFIKVHELLLKLAEGSDKEGLPTVNNDTEKQFAALRGQMFYDLKHCWTVEEMAQTVNLSKSRFYTVYKSIYGTTPLDDIIRARIDKAKSMLRFEATPIPHIAEELGYNNLTHFMRQFKALVGVSPGEYRKNNF